MNKKRLLNHYEWQIRKLNRKINQNKSANYLFRLIGEALGFNTPSQLPVKYLIGEKRIAFAKEDNVTVADLGIAIFWTNARNSFVNKIMALRGISSDEEESSLQSIC